MAGRTDDLRARRRRRRPTTRTSPAATPAPSTTRAGSSCPPAAGATPSPRAGQAHRTGSTASPSGPRRSYRAVTAEVARARSAPAIVPDGTHRGLPAGHRGRRPSTARAASSCPPTSATSAGIGGKGAEVVLDRRRATASRSGTAPPRRRAAPSPTPVVAEPLDAPLTDHDTDGGRHHRNDDTTNDTRTAVAVRPPAVLRTADGRPLLRPLTISSIGETSRRAPAVRGAADGRAARQPAAPAAARTGGGTHVRAPAGHGRRDRRRLRSGPARGPASTPPSAAAATPPPCSTRPPAPRAWSASTATTPPSPPPPTRSPASATGSTLRRARFDQLATTLEELGHDHVAGVLFDLGVSSPQLDVAERGFSYRHDGPLDMRMDRRQRRTAADVVNGYDERRAGAGAAHLRRRALRHPHRPGHRRRPPARRPPTELAEVVRDAIPAAARRTGGHPAKRTFQAVRIEVNDELAILADSIDQAIDFLAPGGRCAVLAYHSGEDRIVKERFRHHATGGVEPPPGLPLPDDVAAGRAPRARRAARRPAPAEAEANPRAESARLRVVEKLAAAGPADGRARAPRRRPAPAAARAGCAAAATPRPTSGSSRAAGAGCAPARPSCSAALLAFGIAFAVVACQVAARPGPGAPRRPRRRASPRPTDRHQELRLEVAELESPGAHRRRRHDDLGHGAAARASPTSRRRRRHRAGPVRTRRHPTAAPSTPRPAPTSMARRPATPTTRTGCSAGRRGPRTPHRPPAVRRARPRAAGARPPPAAGRRRRARPRRRPPARPAPRPPPRRPAPRRPPRPRAAATPSAACGSLLVVFVLLFGAVVGRLAPAPGRRPRPARGPRRSRSAPGRSPCRPTGARSSTATATTSPCRCPQPTVWADPALGRGPGGRGRRARAGARRRRRPSSPPRLAGDGAVRLPRPPGRRRRRRARSTELGARRRPPPRRAGALRPRRRPRAAACSAASTSTASAGPASSCSTTTSSPATPGELVVERDPDGRTIPRRRARASTPPVPATTSCSPSTASMQYETERALAEQIDADGRQGRHRRS